MEHNILIPNLMVKNVAETVKFYQDVLGFSLKMAIEPVENSAPNMVTELTEGIVLEWANMTRAGAEFMFQERASLVVEVPALEGSVVGASQTLYIHVDEDIDEHFERLKDKVTVVVEPTTKFYGMREWYMQDNNGYILGFAKKV